MTRTEQHSKILTSQQEKDNREKGRGWGPTTHFTDHNPSNQKTSHLAMPLRFPLPPNSINPVLAQASKTSKIQTVRVLTFISIYLQTFSPF